MKKLRGMLIALLAFLPIPIMAQGVGPLRSQTYGTQDMSFLTLGAYDFKPIDSTMTYGFSLIPRGVFKTGSGNNRMLAPIHLPAGASLVDMELSVCDNDVAAGLTETALTEIDSTGAVVMAINGPSTTAPEAPGCVTLTSIFSAPVVIDNLNSWDFAIGFSGSSVNVVFVSVRLGYKLQVSPAPATSRYTDVPTTHAFFQYIEALASAGITAGCSSSPPQFCPDAPVTRGQMAVFLSRALGLHWVP